MCKLAHVIRYTVLSENFHFCCFIAMAYIRLWNWVQFCLFNAIYVENGERYDVGLKEGQIGNRQWAFDWDYDLWPWTILVHGHWWQIRRWGIDWHHDLWPWMTLNHPNSRSQDFGIKYLEYGARYDVGHNGGQIGNQQWAFDCDHDLWLWMTLNPPRVDDILQCLQWLHRAQWGSMV